MMRIRVAIVLLAVTVAFSSAAAHPGHDHKVMGTIISITGQSILIKATDGKEQTVQLSAVTKVLNGKTKGDARDLRAGMRVVVNVGDGKAPLTAKELQYTLAAAAKQ